MIVVAEEPCCSRSQDWRGRFLDMVPTIRHYANSAFRHLRRGARDDAIDEVVANTLVAYRRLVDQDREALAYPTVLARFAIARVHAGRAAGTKLNSNDVLSRYAQRQKGFAVERLDEFDAAVGGWREVAVEDRRCCPADLAAFRLDFSAWLKILPHRKRSILRWLAIGESTGAVAKMFGISQARVSQLRGEFYESWCRFHGEGPTVPAIQVQVA